MSSPEIGGDQTIEAIGQRLNSVDGEIDRLRQGNEARPLENAILLLKKETLLDEFFSLFESRVGQMAVFGGLTRAMVIPGGGWESLHEELPVESRLVTGVEESDAGRFVLTRDDIGETALEISKIKFGFAVEVESLSTKPV